MREWSLDDAAAMQEIFANPRVMRYISDGRPFEPHAIIEFIERQQTATRLLGWCRWALELRRPGEGEPRGLLGFTGFGCHFAPEIELGWSLREEAWGRGLATEAGRAALDFGFKTVGFDRVISVIHPENRRSKRVAEKLGYEPGGSIDHEGATYLRFVKTNPEVPSPDPRYSSECGGLSD